MAFVDTSAIFALVDPDDRFHGRATTAWRELASGDVRLVTHNYVLLEGTVALQRRIGIDAIDAVHQRVVPVLNIVWVDEELHEAARVALVASKRRSVSFVDRISFQVMRDLRITRAFTYDPHFADEGFEVIG